MDDLIKQYTKDGNVVSKIGNVCAICMEFTTDINWIGVYLYEEKLDKLVLGPFKGKKAVSIIDPKDGVCGASFTEQVVKNVGNVHDFCGHIACDLNSKSELVIPLIHEGNVLGVLDIDSNIYNKFDQEHEDKFILVAKTITQILVD